MKNLKLLFLVGLIIGINACKSGKKPEEYNPVVSNPDFLHSAFYKLTDVMIFDIFSPPVASRIYSYANLAAYEAYVPGDKNYQSMVGQIKDLKEVPQPEAGKEYCYPLASLKSFMTVARGLTFSVDKYDQFEKDLYKKFEDAGVPSDVIDRSMKYGEEVGKSIMAYAKTDKYPQTRGLRYTLQNKPGTWVPTPPAYADAVEPNWGKIRPIALDSANQFMPPRPPAYDLNKTSPFMKEVMEVYNIGKNLSEEEQRVAWFWDDNAFVMNVVGHVMFANKKMTPGGHWLAITQTICKNKKASFGQTVEAYMLVSFALRDAFIACWDEKYRSHKIRPETVINANVDPKWTPYLQTPPFPEYTSGHSTISGASAEVLTSLFGDNVAFTDSTEHRFGHGVGQFKSFREAASQASVSRVYGGIHFRSACDEGLKAGTKIGQLIIQKAKTKR
ncbi:MAG: vanadium-dependent haloperoxidase [Spirosomataceae bacterium]